jgi:hypothetical protein
VTPPGLTPASGSIGLAAEHFAAALLYLIAGAAGLVWVAPELAIGNFTSPHVAGVTHLFTLGWLTVTIFGALYQLLPVALGAPIRSRRLGHASFALLAPGAGLFAAGVAASAAPLHHAGVALVGAGVLLGVGNVAASLPRARSRDVTWAAVLLAITFLTLTLGLGILLLHNLHTGFIAAARVRVLAIHLHVAVVGWALIMIVGVSHRLLPMFLLAHGADTRWTRRSLVLLAAGVPLFGTGLALTSSVISWAGAALLTGGLGCFLRQVRAFHARRIRRRLDPGLRYVATATGFLTLSAPLGLLVLARPFNGRLATAYVVTGLVGGIVLYVTGFLYKIVPLLAWTVHYRGRMGQGPVPTVADTFSARVAHIQLGLMATGVLLLLRGIALGATAITRCGVTLFLGGVLMFAGQLGRVAAGRRR